MKIENTVCCTIMFFLCNMRENVGLLTHGNRVNVTDTIHGFPGHNINLADVVELLMNQTAEIENLKQQTAEIENLKHQSANLKQQTANDRSTIQSLQNRVFSLEAELNKLNVSKLPSRQDFPMYLKSINQLTQNMTTNEDNNKNLTQQLDVAVKNLDDLKVQVRYISLSLFDIRHSMTEELNGMSHAIQLVKEKVSELFKNISARKGFTALVSSASSSWNSGTLVFPAVITNVGNGYNPSTGVFTAPIAGEYVFFVNVQSYGAQTIYVDVVLNGVTTVRTMAYGGGTDHADAGPNLAVLTLQIKDKVWVKHYSGTGYEGSSITTFSGFLL